MSMSGRRRLRRFYLRCRFLNDTHQAPQPEEDAIVFKPNRRDLRMLKMVAEHGMLTPGHIALARAWNQEAVARRLRELQGQGWLTGEARGFGRKRGRPRKLLRITAEGVSLLAEKGKLPGGIDDDEICAPPRGSIDHLLLLNWLLMHVLALSRRVPFLSTYILSSVSPLLPQDSKGPSLLQDRVKLPESNKPESFVPDAAFCVHHQETDQSLLFFAEVDMNTEDMSNPDRRPGDVRNKIRCYQTYFETELYKRYEGIWKLKLNGFRLLFLANEHAGLLKLCRLVREMPPSDFVWLTDQRSLLAKGLCAAIWVQGGREDEDRRSILGNQTNRAQETLAGVAAGPRLSRGGQSHCRRRVREVGDRRDHIL